MKTNQAGINLITSFEGLRLDAYTDQVGIPTIGYGHTSGVKMGQTITQDEATQFLQADLSKFEAGVSNYVTATINENQFAALVSFSYNLGLGSLEHSTLLQKLNTSDPSASNEFPKWNKAGGMVDNGLVRRRAAEQALFNTAVDSDINPPNGSSDADINVSLEDIENEVLKS